MDFYDLIRERYSCRAYRPDPIDEPALERILEATRLAPTAANRQPFRIVVLAAAGRAAALGRVYRREWFSEAPLVVCACGVAAEAWVREDGRSYLDVDVAIVMDHLVLAATNEGLGTCWVANFDPSAAREVFALEPNETPVALTPLGRPADGPGPKVRRPLHEIVRRQADSA